THNTPANLISLPRVCAHRAPFPKGVLHDLSLRLSPSERSGAPSLFAHVLNRNKNERLAFLGFNSARIHQHDSLAQLREVVPHLEVIHADIILRDSLQQFSKL